LILSNGSARLFFSASGTTATHILCSVKAELGHPADEKPNEGSVQIHVEDTLAAASSSRRKSEEERNYLQSILSELLAPNLLDLESLCIIPGLYAWTLNVDILLLSGSAGNLVDAASHAIRAALQNTMLPLVTPSAPSAMPSSKSDGKVTGSTSTDLLLDSDISQARPPTGLENAPVVITVTVCKAPSSSKLLLLLDATLEEEACSYCQVHVAVDPGDGKTSEPMIGALRKTGLGSLPWALLPDITSLAIHAVSKSKSAFRQATLTSPSQSLLQEQFSVQ
jgi:exosome complex component RRP42